MNLIKKIDTNDPEGAEMENTHHYTLQLRFVENSSDAMGSSELEVLAHPAGMGQPIQGRFPHWEPIFEDICTLMRSSAFHRKAIQRTLAAGLAAHLINRETGDKHIFSEAELASLSLTPMGGLDEDLSSAA